MIRINTDALNKIKTQISSLKGNSVKLSVNRGRKRYDTIEGIVSDAYPSVFTIKADEKLQTFSYFDVLCGTVVFKDE